MFLSKKIKDITIRKKFNQKEYYLKLNKAIQTQLYSYNYKYNKFNGYSIIKYNNKIDFIFTLINDIDNFFINFFKINTFLNNFFKNKNELNNKKYIFNKEIIDELINNEKELLSFYELNIF